MIVMYLWAALYFFLVRASLNFFSLQAPSDAKKPKTPEPETKNDVTLKILLHEYSKKRFKLYFEHPFLNGLLNDVHSTDTREKADVTFS